MQKNVVVRRVNKMPMGYDGDDRDRDEIQEENQEEEE